MVISDSSLVWNGPESIFVAPTESGWRQLTIVHPDLAAPHMDRHHRLFIPVPVQDYDSAVKIVHMRENMDVLDDFRECFRQLSLDDDAFQPTRDIDLVPCTGGYRIAVASSFAELFRIGAFGGGIPPSVTQFLTQKYPKGYAFLVCTFDHTLPNHPIAYTSAMLPGGRMFVPTFVHIHDSGNLSRLRDERYPQVVFSLNTQGKDAGTSWNEMRHVLGDKASAGHPTGGEPWSVPLNRLARLLASQDVRMVVPRDFRQLLRQGRAKNIDVMLTVREDHVANTKEGRATQNKLLWKIQEKVNLHQVRTAQVQLAFPDNEYLTREEFNIGVNVRLGLTNRVVTDRLFDTFDHKRSGRVHRARVVSALGVLCDGSMQEKMALAFRIFDEEGKGLLNANQVFNMLQTFMLSGAQALLAVMVAITDSRSIREYSTTAEDVAEYRLLRQTFENKLKSVQDGTHLWTLVHEVFEEGGLNPAIDRIGMHVFQRWAAKSELFREYMSTFAVHFSYGGIQGTTVTTMMATMRKIQVGSCFNEVSLESLCYSVGSYVLSHMDRREFGTAMHRLLMPHISGPEVIGAMAELIYDAFDPDSHGRIARKDAVVGLSILCRATSTQKLRFVFDIFSKPSSKGRMLSRHGLFRIISAFIGAGSSVIIRLAKRGRELFRNATWDTNDDKNVHSLSEGKMRREYLSDTSRIRRLVEGAYDIVDVDHAVKKISFPEFLSWAKNTPIVSSWLDTILQHFDVAEATESMGFAKLQDRLGFADVELGVLATAFATKRRNMTRSAFVDICSSKLAIKSRAFANTLFDIFDEDCNDKLESREIISCLTVLCRGKVEEKLKFAFNFFDRDHNQVLSKIEFLRFLECFLVGSVKAVEAMGERARDLIGKDWTHMDEVAFRDLFSPEKRSMFFKDKKSLRAMVDEAYREADINDDGGLSYDEFSLWCRRNAHLTEWIDTILSPLDGSAVMTAWQGAQSEGLANNLWRLQRDSGMYKVSIRDLLNAFCQYRQISLRVFVRVMKEHLRVENDVMLSALFGALDVRKRGRLSRSNLVAGLAILCKGDQEEKLRLAFDVCDLDRDGVISSGDFRRFFRSFLAPAHRAVSLQNRAVRHLDDDWASLFEGRMTFDSGHDTALLSTMIAQSFRAADVDRDGCLTYREFRSWIESEPHAAYWIENVVRHLDVTGSNHPYKSGGLQAALGTEARQIERLKLEGQIENEKNDRTNQILSQTQQDTGLGSIPIRDLMFAFPATGKLSLEQFHKILAEGLNIDNRLLAERIFVVFDTDNDGWIERRELMAGLSVMCRGTQSEKLFFAFQVVDISGLGVLGETDLHRFFSSFIVSSARALEALLKEGTKVSKKKGARNYGGNEGLTKATYDDLFRGRISMYHQENLVERMVADALRHGTDGYINFTQFRKWSQTNPFITSWLDGIVAKLGGRVSGTEKVSGALFDDAGKRIPGSGAEGLGDVRRAWGGGSAQPPPHIHDDIFVKSRELFGVSPEGEHPPIQVQNAPASMSVLDEINTNLHAMTEGANASNAATELVMMDGSVLGASTKENVSIKTEMDITVPLHAKDKHSYMTRTDILEEEGITTKKLPYTNPYPQAVDFIFSTNCPHLVEIEEEVVRIPPGETRMVRLGFLHPEREAVKKILLFVDILGGLGEECICFNVTYRRD